MAHTPGPWDDASKYPGIDSVRIFAKTHYIATVGNSDDPRDVTEANARLIAAAPELLALLDEVREFLDNYIDVEDGEDGQPGPNRAMSLDSEIDRVLAQARGERWPR